MADLSKLNDADIARALGLRDLTIMALEAELAQLRATIEGASVPEHEEARPTE